MNLYAQLLASFWFEDDALVEFADYLFCLQYFSVKMMEGIVATSYQPGGKLYIDPAKPLPLARFLPQPKGAPSSRGGRGGGRGGMHVARGGGGGFRGRGAPRGRGPPRGGSRGGGFRGRGRF
ncbi:unnamed protein product [Rhodiola kirilowii]